MFTGVIVGNICSLSCRGRSLRVPLSYELTVRFSRSCHNQAKIFSSRIVITQRAIVTHVLFIDGVTRRVVLESRQGFKFLSYFSDVLRVKRLYKYVFLDVCFYFLIIYSIYRNQKVSSFLNVTQKTSYPYFRVFPLVVKWIIQTDYEAIVFERKIVLWLVKIDGIISKLGVSQIKKGDYWFIFKS